jgi:hypothetical protein
LSQESVLDLLKLIIPDLIQIDREHGQADIGCHGAGLDMFGARVNPARDCVRSISFPPSHPGNLHLTCISPAVLLPLGAGLDPSGRSALGLAHSDALSSQVHRQHAHKVYSLRWDQKRICT